MSTVNLSYMPFLAFTDSSELLVFPEFDTSHQLNPYLDSARLFTKLSIVPPKGIVRLQLDIIAPTLSIWSFSLIASTYVFRARSLKVSHQGFGCSSGVPSSAVNTSSLGSYLLN